MYLGQATPGIVPPPLTEVQKTVKDITADLLKVAQIRFAPETIPTLPGFSTSYNKTNLPTFGSNPYYPPQQLQPIQPKNFLQTYWPFLALGGGAVLLLLLTSGKRRR